MENQDQPNQDPLEAEIVPPQPSHEYAQPPAYDPRGSKSSPLMPILIGCAVFAVIGFIAIPVLLLLPAVNAAREAARRNMCMNNSRQVALGAFNVESSTMHFPVAHDFAEAGTPLSIDAATPGNGGYSWLVKILPYVEEVAVANGIAQDTNQFQAELAWGNASQWAGTEIMAYSCPSYGEAKMSNAYPASAAIGNYVAIAGTHSDGTAIVENGVIVSLAAAPNGRGIRSSDIMDGVSKTLLATESIESIYGSWYCGSSAWVTGFSPDQAFSINSSAQGAMTVVPLGQSTALQGNAFCSSCLGGFSRQHGPSSHHLNVVIHVFADGHVAALPNDVDPQIYFSLITRAGSEPVSSQF